MAATTWSGGTTRQVDATSCARGEVARSYIPAARSGTLGPSPVLTRQVAQQLSPSSGRNPPALVREGRMTPCPGARCDHRTRTRPPESLERSQRPAGGRCLGRVVRPPTHPPMCSAEPSRRPSTRWLRRLIVCRTVPLRCQRQGANLLIRKSPEAATQFQMVRSISTVRFFRSPRRRGELIASSGTQATAGLCRSHPIDQHCWPTAAARGLMHPLPATPRPARIMTYTPAERPRGLAVRY